ncbi:PorT family protein [Flagellimonas sp. 389]|uniref:porin family protein n=1 Tax=Flagellimonas sp. 389 TaxID=2835862 RepID=UPI001BD665A8|nr:porin family protein [Flagellimonas sp. 389]MBS9463719.1 PorT family protein [Flagellimonas sp. 389]
MKKTIIFTVLTIVLLFDSNAQETKFGFRAGANFSNLKFVSDFGGAMSEGATNPFAGILLDVTLSEKLHLQPEALFSIAGARDAGITYVNVPLLLKYYVVEGFNIMAGPQLGILVDAENGTEVLKSTNFVLNVGLGYDLPMGLFFDARYNFGLSNIYDVELPNAIQDDLAFEDFEIKYKTKGFQLGVGYKF